MGLVKDGGTNSSSEKPGTCLGRIRGVIEKPWAYANIEHEESSSFRS
jgi:hypothetical protein